MRSALLGVAVCIAAVPLIGAPAESRTIFDGLWSVVIVTDVGTCDRAYRYPAQIVNGVVRPPPGETDPSIHVSGRADRRGNVAVTVSRGDQYAHGSGRLSINSGSGRWTSPTAHCAGHWMAERRG
jgi:hypothetical protein